ncbi:MAG TPA: hypothetical protein VFT64_04230 [Rickettsiales bacterium]|nr:hypothetical protein [Rickettsiales bacterium]
MFALEAEGWVTVAFGTLVVFSAVPLFKAMAKGLDKRSAQIAHELAEARRLREEAQEALQAYQKKQAESAREAEQMMAAAAKEAEHMVQQSEAELNKMLEKRMKLAMDKIAQAETKALQDVQANVVDIAVSVARTILSEHLARSGNSDVVKQAAAELERKLH